MMQTFLPYDNFYESARVLDNQRLNAQIREALQIHSTLTGASNGWRNHPAVLQWEGHEAALIHYGTTCYTEWVRRFDAQQRKGKREHKSGKKLMTLCYALPSIINLKIPPWLGYAPYHRSHRAVLLGKNYVWYQQFGWSETPAVKVGESWPYFWPSKDFLKE